MPVGARGLNGVRLVTWRLSVSERRTDRDETKSIKLTNYRPAPHNRYRDGAPPPGIFRLVAIGELVGYKPCAILAAS